MRTALLGLTCLAAASPAVAQERPERIVVTGSYLGAAPSGATIQLDRADLDGFGAEDLTLSLTRLPVNIGAEFNTDSGTQNDTSGTANVNLRGLGLDATLVLLDGARMTVSSVNADDGASFVDLNALVPFIAIEEAQIFADGASALYGSDALAGVVDIRTRTGFTGFEARAERRLATEYGDDGGDWQAGVIAGSRGERWRIAGAASWLDRQSLEGTDVAFTLNSGLSALGQPGAYTVPLPGGGSATVIDRDCEAGGGQPLVTGDPIAGVGTPGFCRLDFARFFSVVNNETRLQLWADGAVEIGGATLGAQFVFADNAIERGNSPSLPNLDFPTLPAGNPGNYFGQDVVWFGRPFGTEAGSARRTFDHETWRALVSLEDDATIFGRDWALSARAGYSANAVRTTITDTLRGPFDAAVQGFGGPDCPADAAERGVAPGDESAGCFWFNPFGSGAVVADPTDPRFNQPAVVEDLIGADVRTGDASLATLDLLATTAEAFSLPAGAAELALGAQLRREETGRDHGEAFNAEAFLFIIGGPDFEGERGSWATFAELALPLGEGLDLQLALRHEDAGGASATTPRLALTWSPTDTLSLSATASQAFRAPSLFETVSATTTLEQLVVGPQSLFRAVRTVGSDALDPETADVFTLGARWRSERLRFSAQYWRYDVSDLIVEQNAQAIVDADLADGALEDPRIILADNGEIRLVEAAFVNAPEVTTDGLDFAAGLDTPLGPGVLSLEGSASWLLSYDLTDPLTGATVNAAGRRNFTNFARSLPRLRAEASAVWARDGFELRAGVRHISSYFDDENAVDIDAWTALDLQAGVTLPTPYGGEARLSAGVLNALDAEPPFVATPLGYDTKVHDPRGRVAFVRISQSF